MGVRGFSVPFHYESLVSETERGVLLCLKLNNNRVIWSNWSVTSLCECVAEE